MLYTVVKGERAIGHESRSGAQSVEGAHYPARMQLTPTYEFISLSASICELDLVWRICTAKVS
jgi:hypothetical protein